MKSTVFVVVVACLWSSIKADYTAAVVEYSPINGTAPNATIEINLNEYINFIETARRSRVQIIVFPEYGLTGLVDDPTEFAIEIPDTGSRRPFDNYFLRRLSSAAIEHFMYVVVNLLEKAKDERNNTIYYNTNVVFDKEGTIVAKYRKINLFYEPKLTPGNEVVQFTTDFGVTFGIFTCFDILFYNPSRSLLNGSISDIVYPAAWTSTLPFYHSLTVQQGYAQGNKVNLLAANLDNPKQGLSGSGIYSFDGSVLAYYLSGVTSSKILINTLQPRGTPKDPFNSFSTFGFGILGNGSQSELKQFAAPRDFQSSKYKFEGLDLTQGTVYKTVCHGQFCCDFHVTATDVNSSDIYQLLIFNGRANLGDKEESIKVCTVIACETSDKNTCGSRDVNVSTRFTEISITGHFHQEYNYFFQPVTLNTKLLPIFNTTYGSEIVNETNYFSFNTTRTADNVIVFGIFGRGAASTFGSSFVFLLVLSVLKYLF